MYKDPRYTTVLKLMKAKQIHKFTDIFTWIPYTVVARDFGTNNNRMKKMKGDASLWQLGELYKLADLIGCDKKKLAMMAVKEVIDRGQ